MREAAHYSRLPGGDVLCRLCPQRCRLHEGERGICAVRENRAGTLVSLVYGKLAAAQVDPIEKKPLFHFYPGSAAYSVATVGCNLSCPFCQNHSLSLAIRDNPDVSGFLTTPERVVEQARLSGARSVCFTYSEPTIFFEYMLDIAGLARDEGLNTVSVSNGFIEPEPLAELSQFLDAANIDLKAFRADTYRKVLGARLQPVLDTIEYLQARGVWLEVTTLVVTDLNDSPEELADIAGWLAGVSPDIPWHVSRFHPTHRMRDRGPTSLASLQLAIEIGREKGLRYVYGGNMPGETGESTYCPACGEILIGRFGFSVTENRLAPGGVCVSCGEKIAGRFETGK